MTPNPTTIRLRPELLAKLDAMAQAESRNRSNMLEVLIERAAAPQPKPRRERKPR